MDGEATIRLSAFIGVFAVMVLWEVISSRRSLTRSRWQRWSANLGIVLLNTLLLRFTIGAIAVSTAVYATNQEFGLFHVLPLPPFLAVILSVILLDVAIYWQHRLFHLIPIFWRLHRMHHADLDFDTTTGVRFHPIEIFVSALIKAGLVLMMGAPVAAVVIFEVLLSATSLFNHGNVRLPLGLDRLVRLVLVTPDMHRVHHSVLPGEMNSNYGFSVSWWDRLFGSYVAQPKASHEDMQIGLPIFREEAEGRLDKLLTQPFREGR